ncbi:hypothetical protein I8752_28500 [Nostocaceae cyanobacterium CENA369]|uniref:Uncharacterized protein n=1 Tax=Dendronalium phyllosphericum CENA369 TaxID=1725256 RepID=A0A8J7IMT4_9NOST|nr:hypothetical protein [Dendronalium phyllosphericum]MBH8576857.1 hypothetical protein [Dendronalium phyllosphericum CENA369]
MSQLPSWMPLARLSAEPPNTVALLCVVSELSVWQTADLRSVSKVRASPEG